MASNTDWARSIAATIVKHLRDVEQEVLRNRRVGAMLENRGRVIYNDGGRGFDWRVKYRLHDVSGNTGETPRAFTRVNRYKIAELEHRGYQVTDALFKKERLENRGPEAIIDLVGDMVDDLTESLDENFAEEYYVDGSASGNELRMHGFESFTGTNGTVNISTGAQQAANAADLFGYPNDTYAGLTTGLGDYGGAQKTGIWPNGTADPQYDFWSPIIVCYNSTALPGATDTWAGQGIEAMRLGIIQCQRNSSLEQQPDFIILDRNLYYESLNLLDDKERIIVSAQNGLKSFGFKSVYELDGIEVSWEYGVPADVGYLFNVDCMQLRSMQSQLFGAEGPEYDIDSQSDKWVLDFLGNLKFKSPRNFAKFLTIAA